MGIPDSLSDALLAILVDPIDHGRLELAADRSAAFNPLNGRRYPIRDGLLLLHPAAALPAPAAH